MFETQFANLEVGKMAYWDEGSGDVILLVHGLPTNKIIWREMIQDLKNNYRCIAIDLLDYGESDKIRKHISHKQRANNIIEFIRTLDLHEITIIAHDLGSSVIIDMMGMKPALVKKLVIMSPPVYPDFVEPFIVRLARRKLLGRFLVTIFKRLMFSIGIKQGMSRKDKYSQEVSNDLLHPFQSKRGTDALLRVLRWGRPDPVFLDYPAIIKNIVIPTLLIIGEKDPYIPLSQITRMHDAIANSKLVVIPEASHFLTLDFSEEILSDLHTFL